MRESAVQVQSVWSLPRVDTEVRYTPEQKATVLKPYRERMSLRGLQWVFGS